jgi:UDP:flavonoid glycosyltransferase YjiC (YdhE family)
MSRFLFVTFDGGGNQPPEIGIAEALRARQHHVVFAGYQSQQSRLEQRRFMFIVLPRSGSVDFQAAPADRRLKVLQASVMANPEHLADIEDIIANVRPDAVLVDGVMYAALSAAERTGVPTAALVHSTPAAYETPDALAFRAPVLQAIGSLRARLALPSVATATELLGRFPAIVASIRAMDPIQRAPTWHYIGPVFPSEPAASNLRLPWHSNDARPLVLVSLSSTTAYGNQTARLQTILDGLAAAPVRVIATTGPSISAADLQAAENAAVFAFVPHGVLLSSVAVCVTHAGHGTVMAALAHGVPLVCLPNAAADQPYIACRLAELGASVRLEAQAPADVIRAAVLNVLNTQSFRSVARRVAEEIVSCSGAGDGAAILERLAEQAPSSPSE